MNGVREVSDLPADLERSEVFCIRTVPGCSSGDAWLGGHFSFTKLADGCMLVRENVPAGSSKVPEIVELSPGSWMAKLVVRPQERPAKK